MLKTILLVVLIIVILGAGYWLLMRDTTPPLTTAGEGVGAVPLETQLFLSRLQQLEQIELETDILSDNRFTLLVDFRQDIGTAELGRDNPFAPAL